MPPTIPVIKPAATGAAEASAMPMHSGSATKNTTIDAKASRDQCAGGCPGGVGGELAGARLDVNISFMVMR